MVGLLALSFAAGIGAQSEWSHARLIADAPIIASVVSRERLEDGTVVGPARQEVYIGKDDDERVADFVLEPGRSYVTACGFFVRDGIIYETDAFLPLVVKRR
jgi:hypothetical protein